LSDSIDIIWPVEEAVRMGQLIVRNLDDDLVRRLKIRAAERGHSAEEEHREILRQALAPVAQMSLRDVLMAMPDVGDDADFRRNDDLGRTVDW
jgi:plasmid stability protein